MEIKEGEGIVGRYYVAEGDIPAGHLLLEAAPTAAALSDPQLKTHCSVCFQACEGGECEGCGMVRFCESCRGGRGGEVGLHGAECEHVKKLLGGGGGLKVEESRTLRLLIRLLMLRARGGGGETDSEDDGGDEGGGGGGGLPRYGDLEALCCNVEDMPDSRIRFFHNILKQAKHILPSECRIGLEEGVELLAKLYNNAHELLNPDGSDVDLGFGIFVEACLFNHSCDPNCAWYIGNDGDLCVRTLKQVSKGEDLTIAYWDLHECTEERRKKLLEEFHFECACTRCAKGSEDATDKALRARKGGKAKGKEKGKGGTEASADEVQVRELLEEAKRKLATGKDGEAEALLQKASSASHSLEETHALLLKSHRLWLQVHLRSGNQKGVKEASERAADGLRKVFGAERLRGDLQYGYLLWQGVLAGRELQKREEEKGGKGDGGKDGGGAWGDLVVQARAALRVYATVLGSSHWYVRKLNAEVKKLSADAAGGEGGGKAARS